MSDVPPEPGVPFGARLHQVAVDHPDDTAITFVPVQGDHTTLTWRELDDRSTQLAHGLVDRGMVVGDYLAICLPNSLEHLIASFAGWKVGAVVIPVRWDLPDWERERVLDTIAPRVVVDGSGTLLEDSRSASVEPLDEVTSPHGWGVCSSGSSGSPKAIVMKAPGLYFPGQPTNTVVETYGPFDTPQRILVPAPLYHTNGFTATRLLMAGTEIVLLERFDAATILDLVETYRITGFTGATPMLQRLAQVPDIQERDLSSLEWVQQGAAALPVWLGRFWCDRVGPERFYLSYGASEMYGLVVCRGDEWLAHPGTLGRGINGTEIRILGEDGQEVPTGQVGSIYMRTPTGPASLYLGKDVTPMERTDDGFTTVGDLGWLDDDGFLFMTDRRSDMIVTGGVNVFPAEVEAALSEHPGIGDVVVIGLRDPEWGRRVHAIVQARDPEALDADEVVAFAKERLAPYKVPKTVEFVDRVERTEAMKLRRSELVIARDGPDPEAPGGAAAGRS